MDYRSNSIAEIQKKYAGCNLLMPATTEVQLNPFYKITVSEVLADVSENSGDIFKVGSVKVGKDGNGKDIWEDTFSPTKPLLMKIAVAAGIQFDPDRTYGTRVDENTYKAKAYGAMRLPDGTGKTHADEKVIQLDDEEANFRLEFMDKSIKGITDEKAAKAAAEMFAGKWIDSVNKWNRQCKAYVIDDCDREKYIERSVLVNMTLLRKTAPAKAMTGAQLRVIRALTGMKGQYTKKELARPFAIARATFSPDYSDPEVRQAMLLQGMNSVSSLFGTAPAISVPSIQMDTGRDMFDPEELIGNPAFASDRASGADDYNDHPGDPVTEVPTGAPEPEQNWWEQSEHTQPEPENFNPPQMQPPQQSNNYCCEICGREIKDNVYDYSMNRFGRPLCVSCQRGGRAQ